MLEGLGEPVHQLRELVKDVSFRNSQEREQGELELVRSRLQLAQDYGLFSPTEVQIIVWEAVQPGRGARRRNIVGIRNGGQSDPPHGAWTIAGRG